MAERKITEVTSVLSLNDGDSIFVNSGDALCQLDKEQVLANIGGISKKLLWQNASPASNFAAQKIPLDLSEYDGVYIVFKFFTSNTNRTIFFCSNNTANEYQNVLSGAVNRGRNCIVTDSGVQFLTGYKYSTYGSNAVDDDSAMIPILIYGIKGVQ